MTIQLLQALRIAGSEVAAGVKLSLDPALESDFVTRQVATYVNPPGVGASNSAPRFRMAAGTNALTGLIGSDGRDALTFRSQYVAAAFYGSQSPAGVLFDASGNSLHAQPTSRVSLAETWAGARAITTVEDTPATARPRVSRVASAQAMSTSSASTSARPYTLGS